MRQETINKMIERESYIRRKMGKKYSRKWYNKLVRAISECGIDFFENIGYCGGGDDSCKKESISSKLVPDPKCINWSCWFHDRLRELIKLNLITSKMSDKIMKYSGYFDAINGKTGFAKYKALMIARIYYRGVQLETWWNK